MSDEEYPVSCHVCGSKKIIYQSQAEYTGGGYADYWDEFECRKCGNIWRSKKKTSFF